MNNNFFGNKNLLLASCCLCFFILLSNGIYTNASVRNTTIKAVVDTVEPPSGDINFDGKVDLKDAQLALKVALGTEQVSDAAVRAGDKNGNGKIDLSDAKAILNQALGNK